MKSRERFYREDYLPAIRRRQRRQLIVGAAVFGGLVAWSLFEMWAKGAFA